MKCEFYDVLLGDGASPSTRREWIEILLGAGLGTMIMSPSTRREWIEMGHIYKTIRGTKRLPPHGGSGLKF